MDEKEKTNESSKLFDEYFRFAVEAFEDGYQKNAIFCLCSSVYLIQKSAEEGLGTPHISESQTEKWFVETFMGQRKELFPEFWSIYSDLMRVVKRAKNSVFEALTREEWEHYCKFVEKLKEIADQILARNTSALWTVYEVF